MILFVMKPVFFYILQYKSCHTMLFLLVHIYLVDMFMTLLVMKPFFFLHFAVQILSYYAFCGYCIYEALVFLSFYAIQECTIVHGF